VNQRVEFAFCVNLATRRSSMLDERNDPNRPPAEPPVRQPAEGNWRGFPLLFLAAAALIGGLLFMSPGGDRTATVASNNEPSAMTRPAPAPPAMPPAKTQ
jgi:hypothetical protein